MAKDMSNNRETAESNLKSENVPQKAKEDSRALLEASKDLIEGVGEIVESAEGIDVAEFSDGDVSESSKEGKKKAGSGGGKAVKVGKRRSLPSIEIMQVQVATRIQKEIRVLENEARKIMSASGNNFSPHRLNSVMAKIRSLKEILSNLVYATADAVKNLWLKFVKGSF